MAILHEQRDPQKALGAGDGKALATSPGWLFAYNWREGGKEPTDPTSARARIPPGKTGQVREEVPLLSLDPTHAGFLRPAADSPLRFGGAGAGAAALAAFVSAAGAAVTPGPGLLSAAWLASAGAGVSGPALPAYVGAVPPEGTEPWDWDRTWKTLAATR